MNEKRLYRSRKSKMICGVCGGIGEYFNIDPTLIRLVFILFGCTGGGILAYIIAAIIIPDNPERSYQDVHGKGDRRLLEGR